MAVWDKSTELLQRDKLARMKLVNETFELLYTSEGNAI